ncbi:hypothetical protein BN903_162 [Halorubrum sp. AJ67]|nr:hypothetical protein BN903_162 [Halorubrum sp. AJ67]
MVIPATDPYYQLKAKKLFFLVGRFICIHAVRPNNDVLGFYFHDARS